MAAEKPLKGIRNGVDFIKKNMVTKADRALTTKELNKSSNEVAKEILQAISAHNDTISSRLDEMELKFVTRREFDALKRKVEQLRPVNWSAIIKDEKL